MAAGIDIDLRPLAKAQGWLDRLQEFDRAELMQGLIGLTESQVRRRIEVEKTSPDGEPWPAWSAQYADSRQGTAGSLLQASGGLLDSITSELVGNDEGLVGSNKVYARIHNEGGTTKPHDIKPVNGKALAFGGRVYGGVKHLGSKIPARTFLGYSDENREEIQAEAIAFFEALLQ